MSAQRLSPRSHQALTGGASAAIAPKPPSGRFDLAGSLIIVHHLPKNAGGSPRPPQCCDGRPYWDNNNLNRIRPS